MPIYKCEKCGCAENTALGLYWVKHRPEGFKWDESNEQFKGKPLCSECAPTHYSDGKETKYGKWHGKFPKEQYEADKE